MRCGMRTTISRTATRSGTRWRDAHTAALVVEHGATELWTADRDFARFPGLRVRNPFADA